MSRKRSPAGTSLGIRDQVEGGRHGRPHREPKEARCRPAELDELIPEGWERIDPVTDGSEHFSHRSPASVVTLAYATGIEITGLCGARVVAHRDYEKFPVCPVCEERLALLRATASLRSTDAPDG